MSENNKKLKVCPKVTQISAPDKNRIELCWTSVPYAEKYCVKRSDKPNGDYKNIGWTKDLTYTDKKVRENITYWYKIVAVKALKRKRTSKKSSPIVAKIISDIPAPVETEAIPLSRGAIKLQWKSPGKGYSFVINRRNDFFDQIVPIGRVNKTGFVDKDIIPGQVYHYSIQSILNADGGCKEGNFSEEFPSVFLDCGQIIEAKSAAFKRVFIQVRIVAGADGYILERSADGESFEEVGRTASGTDLRFRDKTDKMFTSYYYRTRAYKLIDEKEVISEATEPIKVKTR